jgi:hypothetical protein
VSAFKEGVKTSGLKNESRRACPELVERGRLNFSVVQMSGTTGVLRALTLGYVFPIVCGERSSGLR